MSGDLLILMITCVKFHVIGFRNVGVVQASRFCLSISLTLTLQLGSGLVRSAHPVMMVNICTNFDKNPSIGSGDMERTREKCFHFDL